MNSTDPTQDSPESRAAASRHGSDPAIESRDLTRRIPRGLVGLARGPAVRWMLDLGLKLEGHQFFSATARDIMKSVHGVEIGAYSYGECFAPGAFAPGTVIGRYVSIAEGVRGLGRNHPTECLSTHPFFFNERLGHVKEDTVPYRGLVIEHDAWLGLRAVLAPGCLRIGIGAVVGAGAVVTHDVPDFAIVVGVPARIVRYRFPEPVQAAIRRSRWWERPLSDCVRHVRDMNLPLDSGISGHPLLEDALAAGDGRRGAVPSCP